MHCKSLLIRHLVLDLEDFVEVVLSQRLIFFVILANFFLLLLDFVLDSELVFATFYFGSNHQDIIKSNNNWVVIIETSGLFELLGE